MLDNNFNDFDLCSLLGNDRSGWGHPIAAAVPLRCQRHITGSIKVGTSVNRIRFTQIRLVPRCRRLISLSLAKDSGNHIGMC